MGAGTAGAAGTAVAGGGSFGRGLVGGGRVGGPMTITGRWDSRRRSWMVNGFAFRTLSVGSRSRFSGLPVAKDEESFGRWSP